jgi:hypothetical protein
LLQGERIRLPVGAIPESEIQQIVLERYSGPSVADENAETIQKYRDDELQRIRQYGLALQIDFNRKGFLFYLMLQIGDRGGNVLCGFGDDELGLPLTRTNPYRLLATETRTAPLAAAPAALQRRLEEDVVLSGPDGSWGSALAALGPVIGADVVSDGYLCRFQSILHARPGEKLVLARRGVTAAEALDLICRRYGCLWWEKEGCCYFRARAWVWELDYEVPDGLLDRWSAAFAHGGIGTPEITALASLTPLQLNGLGNLGGGPFFSRANLDHEEVRQFLSFFGACSPGQQTQLMGPGLMVAPEQAARYEALFRSGMPDALPQPVLLRFDHRVSVDSSVSPPLTKVTLAVTYPEEPRRRPVEFSVEIPRGAGELNPLDAVAGPKAAGA